jgi:hypothetical protein
MPQPFFEVLAGTIDGVNAVFSYSQPYAPGTTALYLNGQLLLASTIVWAETSPATGVVTITAAGCIPRVGDQIEGFALDTTTSTDTFIDEVAIFVDSGEHVIVVDDGAAAIDVDDDAYELTVDDEFAVLVDSDEMVVTMECGE